MLNVNHSEPGRGNSPEHRQRINYLREEYQRTYRLLEEEGKRLNGFLEKTAPVPRGRNPQAAPKAIEGMELLKELTARERDALRCIAEGCSTKETAARLGIRFKTAACHRYRIMQKLGVHETTSLVRIAIRAGVVEI
jgi:DNA-binding NarL/FixJ family response regulator